MSTSTKVLTTLLLLSLALSFASPAHAFDGRSGDKVTIQADEVINDDLYVAANEFVLDGTINGDVVSGGNMVTINGKVSGNVIAGGQTIVINGTVMGDVLAAGSVLYFGENAQIGGDVVAAGYSLELRKGTVVGRDAVVAGYQILQAGDVGRNMMAAASGIEIDGQIAGNARLAAADPNQSRNEVPPGMFVNQSTVPVPAVRPGLTISPSARIKGNLDYVQSTDLTFPAGVVGGSISRQAPPPEETRQVVSETPAQKAGIWALDLLRTLITLILLGLLLAWLFPRFLGQLASKLESNPWASLGLGVVAYAGFFFLILLILFVAIVGAVVFGVLTLGGLSGAVVWLGIVALLALIVGFALAASFLTKIVFGATLGRWILLRVSPALAAHRYWPTLIGVTLVVLVVGLLSFPLIPGSLGWLLNSLVILFGMGAIWLGGREALFRKPAAST